MSPGPASPAPPVPPAIPDQHGFGRLRIALRGAVQGVGFRPFIHRLATALELAGWTANTPTGVTAEVEGPIARLHEFARRIEADRPPHSFILGRELTWLDPCGLAGFAIRPSLASSSPGALILPDIATCPECLAEIRDPAARRFRYPFTNCTRCGPRFTIIDSLPYDRARTTMRGFAMCDRCRAEYENPADRRFHAEPIACPVCGPQLELLAPDGRVLARGDAALLATATALRVGQTAAVKGLGGFQLLADARHEEAVARLRDRKHRETKPFALMFPSLAAVRAACRVSSAEERLLTAPEAPIVILDRLPAPAANGSPVAAGVAPDNPTLGVMLPYTPLHHLLLAELGFPVIATSGNLRDEPICTDNGEALRILGPLADVLLVHDRPIARHADDSVARVVLERELVLRRARGYAPLPIPLPPAIPRPTPAVLATGAHLKSAIACAVDDLIFVSQHIGDLETAEARAAFRTVVADFERLYALRPTVIAADAHPDYPSTRYAAERSGPGLAVRLVQHHEAHALACLAENELAPPALAVVWDGTGFGTDGTIWGGEFFMVEPTAVRRFARFLPFPLPGGDRAVRDPRRSALGALFAAFDHLGGGLAEFADLAPVRAFSRPALASIATAMRRRLNAPLTSSAGRLFDAVAALTGIAAANAHEGQAAMRLEFAAAAASAAAGATDDPGADPGGGPLPFRIVPAPAAAGAPAPPAPAAGPGGSTETVPPATVDWTPALRELVARLRRGVPPAALAASFHRMLAAVIVAAADHARAAPPAADRAARVMLTGGCFQNRLLTALAVPALRAAGFRPYWHQRLPPNDGGIAVGQIMAALRQPPHAPAPPDSGDRAR